MELSECLCLGTYMKVGLVIRRGLPHSRGSRRETVRWKQESARGVAGLESSKNMLL